MSFLSVTTSRATEEREGNKLYFFSDIYASPVWYILMITQNLDPLRVLILYRWGPIRAGQQCNMQA